MAKTWKPKTKCPAEVKALRAALTVLAKKRTGGKLIDPKFARDHLFLGHTKGDVKKIATALARLRSVPVSTLMISSMIASAQKEVLNWINRVPANKLTLRNGTWSISTTASTVTATASYKFITVDKEVLAGMNADDIVKKSRKWATISEKTPKVACQFDSDGTPMIYHLDY